MAMLYRIVWDVEMKSHPSRMGARFSFPLSYEVSVALQYYRIYLSSYEDNCVRLFYLYVRVELHTKYS